MGIYQHLNNAVGPNDWDGITEADYALSFDFTAEDHGSIVVLDPKSRACLQWFYKHLPQDCPRWGVGFAIEQNYVGAILEAMASDGLMSEDDYVEAMNSEERDRHAGENR